MTGKGRIVLAGIVLALVVMGKHMQKKHQLQSFQEKIRYDVDDFTSNDPLGARYDGDFLEEDIGHA